MLVQSGDMDLMAIVQFQSRLIYGEAFDCLVSPEQLESFTQYIQPFQVE